jgi:hypothetical protein
VRERFSEIVFPQVGMSVDMDETEVRIDPKDLFNHRKGDEMIAPQKDWKFSGPQDLSKGLANPMKGLFLVPQSQFQVSHIMKRDLR